MDSSFDLGTTDRIVDAFTKLYACSPHRTWMNTRWLGVPILQTPLDLWIMQEIVYETRPALIIETGTYKGGKALFLASICDFIGNGHIVTVDVTNVEGKPPHPRITYLLGSSISDEIVTQVKGLRKDNDRTMVLLDSDHQADHVLSELRIYSNFVTRGCYLIVEDTGIDALMPEFGPGPRKALEVFLSENNKFVVDKEREKFFMTAHPNGYLRRSQ